jgi:hypothetical protein
MPGPRTVMEVTICANLPGRRQTSNPLPDCDFQRRIPSPTGAQYRGPELRREKHVKHRTAGLNPPLPPRRQVSFRPPFPKNARPLFAVRETPGARPGV